MNSVLAIVRSIHIGSSILVAAAFAFRAIFLNGIQRSEHSSDRPLRLRTDELLKRFTMASLVLLFCSGVAWLGMVAISMNEGEVSEASLLPMLGIILTQTEFGHLWLFRGLLSICVALFLITGPGGWVGLAMAIMLEASLTCASHAWAYASVAGLFASVFDAGHLLVSVLWPGCLPPLLVLLAIYRKASATGSREFVAQVLVRFSSISRAAVAVLGATGLLNAFLLVGSLRALVFTSYGQMLLVKIGLFLGMICLGALNYFVLEPRIVLGSRNSTGKEKNGDYGKLMQSVMCENILLGGVLLIVGFLGASAPPH